MNYQQSKNCNLLYLLKEDSDILLLLIFQKHCIYTLSVVYVVTLIDKGRYDSCKISVLSSICEENNYCGDVYRKCYFCKQLHSLCSNRFHYKYLPVQCV